MFALDPAFKERLSYDLYDGSGNPLLISSNGLIKTSYKWGYSNKYPIAVCKNADPDEFLHEDFEGNGMLASNYSSTIHTGNGSYSGSIDLSVYFPSNYHSKSYRLSYFRYDGTKWNYQEFVYTGQTISGTLDDIRIYPKDAQLTTYTYKPLVGMTSSTDPSGRTTYYEYDSFQRLMNVKDQDGNIVKHTDYRYKNQ
jgi:YD repeat-containing protein